MPLCSELCCRETWDNETVVWEMVERQEGMRGPSRLVPTCPHCGKPLTVNLRCDDSFVEDEGWHAAPRGADRHSVGVFFPVADQTGGGHKGHDPLRHGNGQPDPCKAPEAGEEQDASGEQAEGPQKGEKGGDPPV